MKKVLSILFKILKVILTIAVILVVSVILLQRISNNSASLFGYRVFTIVTGSMEPEYKKLDVIIAKNVDSNTIRIGDDVVYIGKEGSFANKIVTHRVIDKATVDSKITFTTQGIANSGVDPVVGEDQIYGVVVKKSIILSFISSLVSNPFGFMILILVPASILIATEMYDRLQKKE